MRTIQTKVVISSDGHFSGDVPADIAPGEHRAVLVIEEEPMTALRRPSLEFEPYQLGLVSDEMTFRREDIYDDSGR
ncbi:MAG TPA: hypothetical protein VI756_05855 [Blastocatellia bacterium]